MVVVRGPSFLSPELGKSLDTSLLSALSPGKLCYV